MTANRTPPVSKAERKAAVAAWGEEKRRAGIYALRCAARGLIWVGSASDLDTIWNRQSFSLRGGNHPQRDLQAAWTDEGAESIAFEVLETLGDEVEPVARPRALKERRAAWSETLAAKTI
ncbi:GIY-YIG nuclease family protein [Pseudooceanicola sp.]|uniref:GIY-YIG nuclease family protein n=1 Tax=Pseudooceanicola sp. TaxID=1914328 RepID=UPI00262423C9|nr:GIY-YIG nuclease family protein [Pseudooceanicola sp.]MDF1855627.1 GIY-YIG nuclease family protein [Pseudooceanicola sp.]